ncbi:PAS domain S-box protein [Roseospira marina]|uniref:histidine kinase n=1 Tax=Roseospira marina TaxID=140057 RepID=A0A5M6I8F4_9PROT|nr:PAS domain S-box protein [Roseospira marina]KAA5604207.1 PAS domain S-box protein [Roseospira marina]MBB4315695.1 PAS domain S-box-containing protein [Roseospira marina]MBB5088807.1 PAS domain S-box-containing protein [Roseospira marina]
MASETLVNASSASASSASVSSASVSSDGTAPAALAILARLSQDLAGPDLTVVGAAHRVTASLLALPGAVEVRVLRLPGHLEVSRAGAAPAVQGGLGPVRLAATVRADQRPWGTLDVALAAGIRTTLPGLGEAVTLAADLLARALGDIASRMTARPDVAVRAMREAIGARLSVGMTLTEALHGEASALMALVDADALLVESLGDRLFVGCALDEAEALLGACRRSAGVRDQEPGCSDATAGLPDVVDLSDDVWAATAVLPLGDIFGDVLILARRAAPPVSDLGSASGGEAVVTPFTETQWRVLRCLHRFLEERFAVEQVRRRGPLGRFLATVSRTFLTESVSHATADALRMVCESIGAEQAAVIQAADPRDGRRDWRLVQSWSGQDARALGPACARESCSACSAFHAHLEHAGLLRVSRVEDVSDFLDRLPACAWLTCASSVLILPLRDRGQTVGVVTFVTHRQTRRWTDWDVQWASLAAEIIGHALSRHRVEAERAASEDRFRALFQQSREPLLLLDQNAVVLDTNRAAEDLTGIRARGLASRPAEPGGAAGAKPFQREAILAGLSRLDRGRLGVAETIHTRPDGVVVPLELTMQRFEHAGGVHFLVAAEDISARKAAEEAARERAARDELMIQIAKRFVREPLDRAIWTAFSEVGTFLNRDAFIMQEPGDPGGMLQTRLVWRAAPGLGACATKLARLPKARLGLEVGRPWRWSERDEGGASKEGARCNNAGPHGVAVLAVPVIVEDAAVSQIVLADCSGRKRGWTDADSRLLAFLAEMYASALTRARDRSARALSEKRLEAFASNLPGIVWRRVRTRDGTLSYPYVSPGLAKFARLPEGDGRRNADGVAGIVHPDDRAMFHRSVEQAAAAHEDWSLEYRVLCGDGHQKWVHSRGKVHDLPDGAVAWDGLTLDISDLKRSEQALRESETRFRTAFDQAAEGMALIGPDGRWQRVNQSLTTLLDVSAEDMVGTPVIRWVMEEDRKVVMALRRRVALEPTSLLETRVRARRVDGTTPWIHAKVAPVFDEDGGVLYWLAHVQDVSAQKATQDLLVAARDQAEATARAKSDFLAMMSHEIRTPLAGMIGLAQLLQRGNLPVVQSRRAGRIESAGRLLLGMLDDILTLSKAESGALGTANGPFSPASVVSEVLGLLSAHADGKGLKLQMDLAPDLPCRVVGPEALVRLVLFNLGGNAVKFTDRGRVVLRARFEAAGTAGETPTLLFEVEDTGAGIDPADRVRLFAPFAQGRDSMTSGKTRAGVGLGLAICRRMVAAMNGALDVDSEPGVGSRFWFRCPLVAGEASLEHDLTGTGGLGTTLAGTEPTDRVPTLAGLDVLVVDDDSIHCEVLTEMLATLGCRPRGFASGPALLEAASRGLAAPPSLILMDLNMPELDGDETAQCLRGLGHGWAETPVLAVTAGTAGWSAGECGGLMTPSNPQHEALKDSGFEGCLCKPVDLATLRLALSRYARRDADAGPGAWSEGSGDLPSASTEPTGATGQGGTLVASPTTDVPTIPTDPVLDQALWNRRLALLGAARMADRLADLDDIMRPLCAWAEHPTAEAAATMAALAHRVRGAAATLGAGRLADHAGRLEHAILETPTVAFLSSASPPVRLVRAGTAFLAAWREARAAFRAGLAAEETGADDQGSPTVTTSAVKM